jgi:tRNA nucleotidyltransferase (CCA-adding enzyme)
MESFVMRNQAVTGMDDTAAIMTKCHQALTTCQGAIYFNMDKVRWEHFHHQADIGVRGYGETVEQAFEAAAIALTAVITSPESVKPSRPVSIHCGAPDRELLLADWLNALIFEIATRHMLFSRFDASIEADRLTATAWGETIDPARHAPAVEVKGATYTELLVGRQADGSWVAQCVVDV